MFWILDDETNFAVEFVSRNLVTCRISSDSETVEISRFLRHRVSGDTSHDHVDATWNPGGVTHGMIHVVHLCEWLTFSHVSKEENKRKIKKIKKNCGEDK